jgi:uncharacterized membrane protein YoaK (UPF0700 family)
MIGSKSPQIRTSMESSVVAVSVSIQSVDYSIGTKLLPSVLSVIAGSVDVISFLGLGLFTAHITGNLVILAAHLVTGGGDARLAAMLSVPVFMLVVGMTRLLSAGLEAIGIASLRPLLALQCLLLLGFLVLSVGAGRRLDQHAARAIAAGMLAVAAMAVQNVIPQISLIGAPTTAVMTSNVMWLTMDLGEILLGRDPEDVTKARQRAKHTWPAIVGFAVGCGLGAICERAIGLWSLVLPVSLALLALIMVDSDRPASTPQTTVSI